MGANRVQEALGIQHISFDDPRIGAAGTLRGFAMPGREVVVNHNRVAGLDQGLYCVTADVACATGDQDSAHGRPIE